MKLKFEKRKESFKFFSTEIAKESTEIIGTDGINENIPKSLEHSTKDTQERNNDNAKSSDSQETELNLIIQP